MRGDGGRGGSVYLRAERGVSAFQEFRYKRHFKAERVGHGLGKEKHGKEPKAGEHRRGNCTCYCSVARGEVASLRVRRRTLRVRELR